MSLVIFIVLEVVSKSITQALMLLLFVLLLIPQLVSGHSFISMIGLTQILDVKLGKISTPMLDSLEV